MKLRFSLFALALAVTASASAEQKLPVFNKENVTVDADWLRDAVNAPARLYQTPEGYLVFTNGLVSRTFTLAPNVASVGFDELTTNTGFLRSIRPEAEVTINGQRFEVGGLEG